MTGLKMIPTIKDVKETTIAITKYALDLYSHPKGNKCAPNIMANTITIFSGTA
nr:hypothetical protein [Bacillus mycoides]